jgi:hypothetical protein
MLDLKNVAACMHLLLEAYEEAYADQDAELVATARQYIREMIKPPTAKELAGLVVLGSEIQRRAQSARGARLN